MTDSGELRAATVDCLVKWFVVCPNIDTEYMNAFFMTYQAFMTPEELLDKLIELYKTPPVGTTEVECQFHVFVVLKEYLKQHPEEVIEREQATLTLQRFTEELEGNKKTQHMARDIKALHDKYWNDLEEKAKQHHSNKPVVLGETAPLSPGSGASSDEGGILKSAFRMKKALMSKVGMKTDSVRRNPKADGPIESIWDLSDEAIAQQLCLMDYDYYSEILLSELMNQNWSKKPDVAPNVLEDIYFFNRFCTWVAYTILEPGDIKLRVERMTSWIRIAKRLRRYNNFNMLMAVCAGINNAAVFRLKLTKAAVPQKRLDTLAELAGLMNSNQSFQKYRTALAEAQAPCIPYLGVYLSDLTFIEDGNKATIDGLINWFKHMRVYSVLAKVREYQQFPYPFQQIDEAMDILHEIDEHDQDILYNLSLQREPRQQAAS
eukprot:GFYU01029618.1.p1 GENE.GFYU01029618.1~~GFYU01029618.1.p1  ORF type:complete len:433 (-),score=120.40 GFYU01029618.1:214-1512(-)